MFRTVETSRVVTSIGVGDPENTTGNQAWPSLSIDYIGLDYIPPTTIPYLSQKDARWGSKEYDSASSWAGINKSGIERWGCALTSTAMMLQNYGIKDLAGADLTPDTLNTWLKSQSDGYVGPGLLNWIAVTRYAKESYLAGHATTKLEYVRSYPPTTPVLPAILGLPGHFVVAHTDGTSDWQIHDPANQLKTTLAKTTTVNSINRFIPSLTDLSYMMFVTQPGVTAKLKNSLGVDVPLTFTDEYISDDMGEVATPSAVRTTVIPKPANDTYRLVVNKPAGPAGEIKIYLYDDLADAITPETFPLPDLTNTFEIQYATPSGSTRSVVAVDTTAPPAPTLLSPDDHAHLNTAGLVLDWSDVTDPSGPVTYNYKSAWSGGGHYGPVSTGTNSFINAPGTSDNTYTWQVQACDSLGNCSEWASRQLIVDSTAPTVDLVFPTPGPSSNYFEAVFSDLVDPIEATSGANYYLSNWPGAGGSGDLVGDATITYNESSKTARVLFTSPGWYISPEQLWGVQNIHDLADNLLSVNPYTEYSTPMTAPELAGAPTTTPNPTNQTTQTWSWLAATDVGSGVKGYSARTYDVAAQQYLSDWLWIGQVLGAATSLDEGSWQLSLQATDNVGNVSTVLSSETLVVDTTGPSTPINLHFDNPNLVCGGYSKDKMVTVDWDDASDNTDVYGYEYNIDYPLANGTGRSSWTTTFTTSSYRGSLNEGIHYIKIRTKDTAGNYSAWSNSCAITYDSHPPTLDSQTTFDGWYKEAQTSYFDYTDINMADDYMAPNCEIATEGFAQSCPVTPNVCDKAGNCNTTARTSNAANIDLTKPLVNLDTWGQTLRGTASDTLSLVDKIEIRLTKPGESEATFGATGTTIWSYTIDPAPIGHYKVIVVAYDVAGNVSDAIVKEYDINPTSGQAAPSSTPTPTPSPSGLVAGASTQKVEEGESPMPSMSPSTSPIPSPSAEILGEAIEPKPDINYWWLLFVIPAISFVVYLVARRR
ncbi:MAG: hypothetical protein WAV40_03870 [Microgenomates group bacterium]